MRAAAAEVGERLAPGAGAARRSLSLSRGLAAAVVVARSVRVWPPPASDCARDGAAAAPARANI